MDPRSTQETSLPLAWPLAGSLLLTALTVALVCGRPAAALHSWGQVFSLATLYLLAAGSVHALAVWGVCRVRDESESAGWRLVWQVIWVAWIAIVWLPLIALLTSERSSWVAAVLPVSAVFATLLLKGAAAEAEVDEGFWELHGDQGELFYVKETPPLWRVLLPAIFAAAAVQMGIALAVAGHSWAAGCLLGAAAIYPVDRLLERPGAGWGARSEGASGTVRRRSARKASAGNSVVVWMMLVLALAPLMTIYTMSTLGRVLGLHPRARLGIAPPSLTSGFASGYSGVILLLPRKPRAIVLPKPETAAAANALRQPRDIPFDGAYWYFQQPDTRPAPTALVMHGDPLRRRMRSTDDEPIIMEAHQPLGRQISMSCCGAVRVNLINADNVPGSIAMEVLLRDTSSKRITAVSLGTIFLPSSLVSPMPLKRPPVEESIVFPMRRAVSRQAREKSFNEITVRIKPEISRSLVGPQVSIRSFVLQP